MERNAAGLTEAEFLANYNPGDYERPSVTVDMMVLRVKQDFSCLQILLIKRKDHPFINCFALPGGFINMRESAYEAACRELQEETGLTNIYLEQIYTMSKPDRDPRMRIIDIAYAALLPFGYQANVKAGDDAKDALWFDIDISDDHLRLHNEEKDIHIKYQLETKTFKNGILTIENKIPVQDGDVLESRFAVTRRNRTIHARMREYLYELKHDERLDTAILNIGDGMSLSVKKTADKNDH